MKNQTAFTLIELLIVAAIIGILAAIAIPNLIMAQMRANLAKVRGDFKALGTAIEMYRLDQGKLPPMTDHGYPGRHYRVTSFLTTPVSYIPFISPDPFQNKDEDPFQIIADAKVFTRYRYHDVIQLFKDNDVIDIPSTEYDYYIFGSFRFLSVGPDRNYQGYTRFDTSNGLFSRGDIYMAENGMEDVLIPGNHVGSGTFR